MQPPGTSMLVQLQLLREQACIFVLYVIDERMAFIGLCGPGTLDVYHTV